MNALRVPAMPLALDWAGEGGAQEARADGGRLRAMFDEHYAFVWRSLGPMGVPEADLDDCAQQVFLVASRRLSSIAVGSERAFLFGTARWVAAEAKRTKLRQREVPLAPPQAPAAPDDEPVDLPSLEPLPDETADQARLLAILDAQLAAMDEDLRAVFVLYEVEEMGAPEIASLLGIPEGTVRSRLRRAREDFHDRIARLRARKGGPS